MNVAKAALRTAEALICPAAYQRLCKIPWVSLGIFHIDTYIIIHIYNYTYIHIRIHRYVAGWYKGYLQKIHLSHVDVNPSVKMVVPKNGVHPPQNGDVNREHDEASNLGFHMVSYVLSKRFIYRNVDKSSMYHHVSS
jgi:hypothetical protein